MPQIPSDPIHIEHATRGPADAPAFLLIRGLSTQLIQWPEVFLDGLVEAGFRAVVFDNRDCGLSTKCDAAGMPSIPDLLAGRASAPYSLEDMAADAVSVLDALGIERAHVAGMSLGGMIAQHLAFSHGDRCLSVTSIMSTSGAPGLPSGTPEAMASLSSSPEDPGDRASVIRHLMRHQALIGSPAYPQTPEEARRYCEAAYDRCYCPEGTARQMAAVLTDTTRAERLAEIRVPFQVIHGTDDPLIPIECGRDTARRVPKARFVEIPGMGHDVTIANAPRLLEPLVAFARANG
jgi:pimeloyl-ACP methyl ester carboxylesterase